VKAFPLDLGAFLGEAGTQPHPAKPIFSTSTIELMRIQVRQPFHFLFENKSSPCKVYTRDLSWCRFHIPCSSASRVLLTLRVAHPSIDPQPITGVPKEIRLLLRSVATGPRVFAVHQLHSHKSLEPSRHGTGSSFRDHPFICNPGTKRPKSNEI
jgi:hypothetical protein